MKKFLILAAIFILLSMSLWAQLSPLTRVFINYIEKSGQNNPKYNNIFSSADNYFPVKAIGGRLMIGALAIVNEDLDESALKSLGIMIGTKAGDIWSLNIPIYNIRKLENFRGLEYVDVDLKKDLELDLARADTKVDQVHQGITLPQPYTGKGVIVGVIDQGFDLTHPAFYDKAGQEYRIERVWNMHDSTGTPPYGLYGTELTDGNAMINYEKTYTGSSHGSHTASTAAGAGYGSPQNQFCGVAYESNLVLVDVTNNSGSSGLLDALSYIFNYASTLPNPKPAVVNLSMGSNLGSAHDGKSLFDQAVKSLVGKGKILIQSAGNSGDSKLHLGYNFTTGESIFSFIYFDTYGSYTGWGIIELWGAPNTDFELQITGYDNVGDHLFWTKFASTKRDFAFDTTFSDIALVSLATEHKNPSNNRPHMTIICANGSENIILGLELICPKGMVHLWNKDGTFSDKLPDGSPIAGYTDGNTDYTINSDCGDATIHVGAYTTKNSYLNIFGEPQETPFPAANGDIAPFSSHGPTVDGRTKPDITAPGNVVVAAYNSFDPDKQDVPEIVAGVTNGSKYWSYGAMQGTSMSSPMITGIVGLMLQANPNLDNQQVKTILKSTARTDAFTGAIPAGGSNIWGWGKVDAWAAVTTQISKFLGDDYSPQELILYPNPSDGNFTLIIKNQESKQADIEILDCTGIPLYKQNISMNNTDYIGNISLNEITDGLYFVKIRCGTEIKVQRLVIYK